MKKSYVVKYKSLREKDVLEKRTRTQEYFNGIKIGFEREVITYGYVDRICEVLIRAKDESDAYSAALSNRCEIGISEIMSINEIKVLGR